MEQVKIVFKGKKLLDFSRLIEIVNENYIPDGLDISNGVLQIKWRGSLNLSQGNLWKFFKGRDEDEYFILVKDKNGVSTTYGKLQVEECL